MPDCDYCDESFASEDAYLEHLAIAHDGELGRIDQRRADEYRGDGDGADSSTLLLAGFVVVLGIVVVGILAFVLTQGGNGDDGQVHEHGPMTVTVDGDELDLEQPQYNEPQRFHFHYGDGNIWHMHPDRLTLEEAMTELGMPITETSVTIDGETYDDEDSDTSVDIAVNGDPVELDHELSGTGVDPAMNGEGDHIQITIETPDGDGLPPEQTVGASDDAGSE